jgi:hypothetical protein
MKYFLSFLLITQFVLAQSTMKPEDTEVWEPEPKVVQPGVFTAPPSDAIILFDGSDFSKWRNERTQGPVEWTLNPDKSMTVKPRTGGIETKEEHGSVQLHIEWKSPTVIKGEGQGRGNSGILFQRRYEVQVLDSYQNRTYSNGQAGSIYKQYIPLVNAMRPTGEWQVYDIIFNAPEFNDEGEEIKPGNFIVFHNGVLIQNAVELRGTTEYIGKPKKGRDVMPGYSDDSINHRTLLLQDHGDLVSYRNIWMRKL